MTKSEFIHELSRKTGFTKKDCLYFLDAFCQVIAEALERGERVKLHNFGVFEVKKSKSRTGKDFANNTTCPIPPKRVPNFIPCDGLKKSVGGAHRGHD